MSPEVHVSDMWPLQIPCPSNIQQIFPTYYGFQSFLTGPSTWQLLNISCNGRFLKPTQNRPYPLKFQISCHKPKSLHPQASNPSPIYPDLHPVKKGSQHGYSTPITAHHINPNLDCKPEKSKGMLVASSSRLLVQGCNFGGPGLGGLH